MSSMPVLPALLGRHRTTVAPILVFVGAAIVISSAWGFQLLGGYVPCKLCLEQRVPYYVGLPIAAIAGLLAILAPGRRGVTRLLLALFALIMLYGAGLGVYQSGAEWGFWPGPSDCGGGGSLATDAGGLLNSLQSIHVVSCTEASWRLLGLSFAGWNVVASLCLVLVAAWGALPGRRD